MADVLIVTAMRVERRAVRASSTARPTVTGIGPLRAARAGHAWAKTLCT